MTGDPHYHNNFVFSFGRTRNFNDTFAPAQDRLMLE